MRKRIKTTWVYKKNIVAIIDNTATLSGKCNATQKITKLLQIAWWEVFFIIKIYPHYSTLQMLNAIKMYMELLFKVMSNGIKIYTKYVAMSCWWYSWYRRALIVMIIKKYFQKIYVNIKICVKIRIIEDNSILF